jgi:hypothetical protein
MWLRTVGSLAFAGAIAGCAPASPSDEALTSSIVVTLRAPDANFASYRTYFLRPEIRELTTDNTGASLDSSVSNPLLTETRNQMNGRGYQEVDDKTTADLAVEMVYVSSEWVATYCYSWYDPYYWGYPTWYYYPYYGCSGTTYQTNTLATMLTDLTPARDSLTRDVPQIDGGVPPQVLHGIWFSGINGLVISTADSLQKGVDGIEQAFQQSPYLSRR